MAKNKFYVTTPIYYVNDVPHMGHAYTTIAADILARYHKLLGENVLFLTGTDEHGAKVALAAKEHGKSPKEYADEVTPRFKNAWKILNIEYDYFIRTTGLRHGKLVQEVLQIIYDNGYIKPGIYKGWYCVGCERFLTEAELVNGRCPLHPNLTPVHQKEKNYFFKLSSFKDDLIEIFQKEGVILPIERRNEILGKLKQGLEDVSISRKGVTWGIPVPWDKKQTVYVWVDALFNYYTATQFIEGKKEFWPATVHLIGKDILWFHTVIWYALLLAAELPLPKTVFAHGFFTINGQKMSKSLGNVIAPADLVTKFGADGARFLMLSGFPFGQDGDISLEKFQKRYNADLANGLGNLVARVAKLAQNADFKAGHLNDIYHLSKAPQEFKKALEEFRFNDALALMWNKVGETNKFIDEKRPWDQKGEGLAKTLEHLVSEIREIAMLLVPFLPETALKIERQFAGPKIKSGKSLFPRLV